MSENEGLFDVLLTKQNEPVIIKIGRLKGVSKPLSAIMGF